MVRFTLLPNLNGTVYVLPNTNGTVYVTAQSKWYGLRHCLIYMVRFTLLPNLNIYMHHVSQIEGTGVTVQVHAGGGK